MIHEENVGPEAASLKVPIGRQLSGQTSALLKSLTVRAESASGLPESPWATLEELDRQRAKLPDSLRHDLTSQVVTKGTAGLEGFRIWGAALLQITAFVYWPLRDEPAVDGRLYQLLVDGKCQFRPGG